MYCPNRECPDLELSGVVAEYRAEVSVCPRCGSHLVARPPNPVQKEVQDEIVDGLPPLIDDPEPVYMTDALDLDEVTAAERLLEAAGIPFEEAHDRELVNERAQVVFLVPARHAEAAREVLAGIEGQVSPERNEPGELSGSPDHPMECVLCGRLLRPGEIACRACEAGTGAEVTAEATPPMIGWLRHKQRERFLRRRFDPDDAEEYQDLLNERMSWELQKIGLVVALIILLPLLVAVMRACGGPAL